MSQSDFNSQSYDPPGPVAQAFLLDRSTVRGIMGPFGSGKTNVCIMDALTCAWNMPRSRDGNRYFRGIVLRDNFTNLWKTTIPSWEGWFPRTVGNWTGGEGRQAIHKMRFDMPDGSVLFFEIWFLALQDNNIENVLRGIEFTWGWINEADLVTPEALTYMVGRVMQKRYPRRRDLPEGADYYAGIVMDYNPPDMDSYLFELFEEQRPHNHRLFRQPSGRGPRGENRMAIPQSVYEDMARTNAHRPDWVQRMVDGEYGFSRDGTPVYINYLDSTHCAEQILKAVPGIPLRLAFDQGLRGPAMVVAQYMPNGQLRVLDEFTPGRMGPTEFARRCKVLLETKYPDIEIEQPARCDPAGKQGSNAEDNTLSWLEIVQERMGIAIEGAESNEIEVRIDGVAQLLRFFPEPNVPGILISPACKNLRKGFNSHYRYKKRTQGVQTTIDPKPEKNEYADPHDALQYLVQDLMGLDGVISGALTGTAKRFSDPADGGSGNHQLNTTFQVF